MNGSEKTAESKHSPPSQASVLSDRSLMPLSVSDPNKNICEERGVQFRPADILDGQGQTLFRVGDDAEAVILAHDIVRAVNSHDALVKALEKILLHMTDPNIGTSDTYPVFGLNFPSLVLSARAALAGAKP